MKSISLLLGLCLLLLFPLSRLEAFSPYEAYLASDRPTQVGLIAEVADTQNEPFVEAINRVCGLEAEALLAENGIRNVSTFSRVINGREYAVVHFVYDGTRRYLDAAEAFETASHSLGIQWAKLTKPHPRAVTYGRDWLQMEWINYIRGYEVEGDPTNALMIGCRIRPEKEAEYRTLHQTVWPGVVDQVVRGKIRDLCIFLVELDGDLVEFLYLEYMGDDQAADDKANAADPINQRWWKLTDACQMPFEDVKAGTWTLLDPIKGD
jgi:L-rhamnose mutarotase